MRASRWGFHHGGSVVGARVPVDAGAEAAALERRQHAGNILRAPRPRLDMPRHLRISFGTMEENRAPLSHVGAGQGRGRRANRRLRADGPPAAGHLFQNAGARITSTV